MKRNLLSIVILVLLVVNLVLTSVLMFSILPETKKTDKMITDICSILDLELTSNQADGEPEAIPIDDLVFYDFTEEMILSFKPAADGTAHYAVLNVSLAMNSKHEDYEKYGATIGEKESLMKNAIVTVIGRHTCEEGQANVEGLQNEILEELQNMFGSRFINQVIFSDIKFQ